MLIVGGGLGGLFAGAMLSKEGFEVVVVEKNAAIGGGLQTFERFGEHFDTGMHVVGGMQPGGNVWKICRYLGILEEVKMRDVDDDCTDRLFFLEDGAHYDMGKGRQGFTDALARWFPEERKNIERYVDTIFAIADRVDLLNLRPTAGQMGLLAEGGGWLTAADDFIAGFTANRRLRSVLAYMNPLYGGRAHETPAYVHAIISWLYIKGASRFVGGSAAFARLLADVITKHGGQVLTNEGAEWVEVNDRRVDYVRTVTGKKLTADYYIAAIHPCTLLNMTDEKAFTKAYRDRLDSITNTHSAFSLFIKLKPDVFPYINHSEYFMTKYDDVWNFSRTDRPWPLGFLMMTPPNEGQGEYATKVIVTAPMPFAMVEKWKDTKVGRRGKDYEDWKAERARELLRLTEVMHPGFGEAIAAMNTASPLTIRDYYGVKEGSICGFAKNCNDIVRSQVPVVTKVRNLLLTGQNNNLHGFCGVPLTAINTCEAILGTNYIVNKINACAG